MGERRGRCQATKQKSRTQQREHAFSRLALIKESASTLRALSRNHQVP